MCHLYRIPHSQFLSWSQLDRDKAIWAYVRERSTCAGCGTRADEWDPQEGGGLDAYKAEQHLCFGCRAIEVERERAGEKTPAGMQIVLKRKGVAGGQAR